MMPANVKVKYFVESREESVRKGFKIRAGFLEARVFTADTVRILQQHSSSIALAVFAEEEGIASVVSELNVKGIATDLWLNLPYDLGYWQSKGNIAAARKEAGRLLNWISRHNLKVRNIGLDIEPTVQVIWHLVNFQFVKLSMKLMRLPRPANAQNEFESMIREINEACGVDIYKLPLIGDYALSRRLFNLFAIPEGFLSDSRNSIVSMLYSSFSPIKSPRFIERFIRDDEIPALGIVSTDETDPGIDLNGTGQRLPLLSQNVLTRDVLQVRNIYSRRRKPAEMYVHALNGIGTLEKIATAIRFCYPS
jgi:hypothetical protein